MQALITDIISRRSQRCNVLPPEQPISTPTIELPFDESPCVERPLQKQSCVQPSPSKQYNIFSDEESELEDCALSDSSIFARLDDGEWLAPLPEIPPFPFVAEPETSPGMLSGEVCTSCELPDEQPSESTDGE